MHCCYIGCLTDAEYEEERAEQLERLVAIDDRVQLLTSPLTESSGMDALSNAFGALSMSNAPTPRTKPKDTGDRAVLSTETLASTSKVVVPVVAPKTTKTRKLSPPTATTTSNNALTKTNENNTKGLTPRTGYDLDSIVLALDTLSLDSKAKILATAASERSSSTTTTTTTTTTRSDSSRTISSSCGEKENKPLRSYQKSLLSEINNQLDNGKRHVLVYLPTGGGKTRIAVEVIKKYRRAKKRCLFIVNKEALIEQTADALREVGLSDDIGFIKAGYKGRRRFRPSLMLFSSLYLIFLCFSSLSVYHFSCFSISHLSLFLISL